MTLDHLVTGAEGANPSIFRDIITLPKSGIVLSIAMLPNGRVVTVGKSMGGRF